MKDRIILLAEDNPDDVDLTLRALKRHHIPNKVVLARDGNEALEFLFGTGTHAGRDTKVQPALVLLDLNLPKVGGIEVLRRLRSDPRTSHVPVVVLTSSTENQDLIDAYASHVNSFVRKPVDFVEFAEAARLLGLYWMLLNELPAAPCGKSRA